VVKVYDGLNAEGKLVYFQVSNALLSRRAACRVVSRLPGVSILSRPSSALFGREDVFCKFAFGENHFELWEPFGDNSRFHISAKPIGPSDHLQQLRNAFAEYQPISGITRWLLLVTGIVLLLYRFYFH
jgi:hypothetical protein